MNLRPPDQPLAAVVLAAGAGSRFSGSPGGKLLADLGGRPVLAHVLDTVRAARAEPIIVVLGHGHEVIERTIGWRDEVRVVNPRPERGLASSLRVGFAGLAAEGSPAVGAYIVLADQPRLRPEVLRALRRAVPEARAGGRAIIAPSYVDQPGARNPILLLRTAWDLVERAQGDTGLGDLIDAQPELVLEVPAAGDMPDVDTPEDLARLAATDGLASRLGAS